MASKAKISGDEAVNAVKAAYPGNTVQGAVLGDENGYLIYVVKMADKSGITLMQQRGIAPNKFGAVPLMLNNENSIDNFVYAVFKIYLRTQVLKALQAYILPRQLIQQPLSCYSETSWT